MTNVSRTISKTVNRGFASLAQLAAVAAMVACGSGDPPLGGGGGSTPTTGSSTTTTGTPQEGKLTVVVLVIDSLMPEELGRSLTPTPNLDALRGAGTEYRESRAVFMAETLPNHVAMMTGVYPEKNGVVANEFWDGKGSPEARWLTRPSDLTADTLFTSIERHCPDVRTAAVLSKDYLHDVFAACDKAGENCGRNREPDFHFDPASDPTFQPPPSSYVPDLTVSSAANRAIVEADFMFASFGEVDRLGHAELPGAVLPSASRDLAIVRADVFAGQLIDVLRESGRWNQTVLFLVSDHGMDFSAPLDFVDVQPVLDEVGGLFAVANGGVVSIYLTDAKERDTPAGRKRTSLARKAIAALPGVDQAWSLADDPLDPGHDLPTSLHASHPNVGDLVASAKQGFRFNTVGPGEVPTPGGNHGHLPTMRNVFVVGGGAEFLKSQVVDASGGATDPLERLPDQSEVVDLAPTIAWLLGMPTEGYDGRVLSEAFSVNAPPSRCGALNR